jgi:hypothetical protein
VTGDLAVIVAFIEARLAEDKQRVESLLFACKIPEKTPDFFACGGPAAEAYWEHFGPARMLRDVEAKRAILAEYAAITETPPADDADRALHSSMRGAVAALAAVWSNHPDYRKEGAS